MGGLEICKTKCKKREEGLMFTRKSWLKPVFLYEEKWVVSSNSIDSTQIRTQDHFLPSSSDHLI